MDVSTNRVCILRLSAIGDVCNCLASVRALQLAEPALTITWIIGKTEYSLVRDTPGVEFIIFDKSRGLAAYRDVWRALGERTFDHVLLMHASMRANLLSLGIRSRARIGFDRQRARDFQWLFSRERIDPRPECHVVDGFMQFVQKLTTSQLTPAFGVDVNDSVRTAADSLVADLDSYALISPMSSERANNFRNWPINRYAQLIDWLDQHYQLQVVLTGGPSERERAFSDAIEKRCQSRPKNLTGETQLPVLYALIEQAAVVICPDSGPMHLANAADTKVVGLFATSNPGRTGPYRRRQLVANVYPQALQTYLNKTVAEVRWGQRVRDPQAMLLISLELVCEKLTQALATTR